MKIKKIIKSIFFPGRIIENLSPDSPPATGRQYPSPSNQPSLKKLRADGLNIIGHIYNSSGRGEDARTAAAAAIAAGIPFKLINTFGNSNSSGKGLSANSPLRKYISSDNPYNINLFFINADEMHNAYSHLGQMFFQDKYNIGCWAWELREFPNAWRPAFNLIDEIWAPSRFIQEAIAQKTTKPVIYMPLAVACTDSRQYKRLHFKIPDNKFIFLTFFDFTSYFQRKNPFAVLEAYGKACQSHQTMSNSAVLVIKINNWIYDRDNCESLKKALTEFPNVLLIQEVLNDQEMKSLMNCCDCLVSLHRSEGFGRGPAEAMSLNKAVITTSYSGNMDYCNEANAFLVDYQLVKVKAGEYPYGVGQLWAEAEVEQAADLMHLVFSNPGKTRCKAANGCDYIKTYHSPEHVGQRYARRLNKLNQSTYQAC